MTDKKFRSKLESECYFILQELFPNTVIEHDYPIGGGLKLDFYIRSAVPMAVEVDGPQHREYNSRFHDSIAAFEDQVRRDAKKTELCRMLGVPLIRLDGKRDLGVRTIQQKIMSALDEYESGEWKPEPISKKDFYHNRQKEYIRKRRKDYYRWCKEHKKNGGVNGGN